MKQNAPVSGLPLPVSSSEWRLRLIRPLGKLVTCITMILVIETLWGHPAIRWQWMGGNTPSAMRSCVLVTCLGERHFDTGYRRVITFQPPYRTIGRRAWDLIKQRFQDSPAISGRQNG